MNRVADGMTASREREYWESTIRAEVKRAGLDPGGCVGAAHLHMLVDEVKKLRRERDDARLWIENLSRRVDPLAEEAHLFLQADRRQAVTASEVGEQLVPKPWVIADYSMSELPSILPPDPSDEDRIVCVSLSWTGKDYKTVWLVDRCRARDVLAHESVMRETLRAKITKGEL